MTGRESRRRDQPADSESSPVTEPALLHPDAESVAAYRDAVDRAIRVLEESYLDSATPYAGGSPDAVAEALPELDGVPERGRGLDTVIEETRAVLANSVGVFHPRCLAHLHCPPTIAGLAAEVLVTATNQSMDSWDQSPAATHLEERLVADLADLFGYGDRADGVFTSGGTQSNFLGLLLARNRAVSERWGVDVSRAGLPPEADDLRVLCSEAAHFTARQAAAHLGLGDDAVVAVPTDGDFRLDLDALDRELARLEQQGADPFALVGTAGTTDYGSIDPLDGLADRARDRDLWFHVDAAWGGALAVSETHREKLAGIDRADSIAVDFHKLFFQPISCGAFLLRDGADFDAIGRSTAYLDPEGTDAPNLVGKSVQTTRRFDALKPFVTFRALGREGMADLVDASLSLAADVAAAVADHPEFELLNEPTLGAILFRYRPTTTPPGVDASTWRSRLNERIRGELLEAGEAVVARTTVDGEACLKLTLLNPRTTLADVESILTSCTERGRALEATPDEVLT